MDQARTMEQINAEIEQTKQALINVRGTETEVYSRIVGYYRSVRNWNKGKRDEYNHRKQFVYETKNNFSDLNTTGMQNSVDCSVSNTLDTAMIHSFILFVRKTCPNCPPLKEYLSNSVISGTIVDVDTHEGLEQAQLFNVLTTPTAIFVDAQGNEVTRIYDVQAAKTLVSRKQEIA